MRVRDIKHFLTILFYLFLFIFVVVYIATDATDLTQYRVQFILLYFALFVSVIVLPHMYYFLCLWPKTYCWSWFCQYTLKLELTNYTGIHNRQHMLLQLIGIQQLQCNYVIATCATNPRLTPQFSQFCKYKDMESGLGLRSKEYIICVLLSMRDA